MKKYIAIILTVIIAFSLCACSNSQSESIGTTEASQNTKAENATVMPTVLNTAEYTLYQNIFYNKQGDDYVGKEVTKSGTFTTIDDQFNGLTRYYVWGYNDQTKCCDWQWELSLNDTSNLPSNGSLVEVTGTFNKNNNALDGYWIESPTIKVTQNFSTNNSGVDMTTMSGTLERVQLINIQQNQDKYEGQQITIYGRIKSPTTLQHPYYDGAWEQEFNSTDVSPAIGTEVIVKGTFTSGKVTNASVNETNEY